MGIHTRKIEIHMKKHNTHLYVGQHVTPRLSPSVTGQPPISGKPFFHPTFLASLTLGAAIWEVVSCHTAQQKEKKGGRRGRKAERNSSSLSPAPALDPPISVSAGPGGGPRANPAANFPPPCCPPFFYPGIRKRGRERKIPFLRFFCRFWEWKRRGNGGAVPLLARKVREGEKEGGENRRRRWNFMAEISREKKSLGVSNRGLGCSGARGHGR